MTLQQIYYTIKISETGSMNKAAEILYVAQPSLSGAIRDLENELGITIFHRSGRGVTLTMPDRCTPNMKPCWINMGVPANGRKNSGCLRSIIPLL